MVGFVISMKQVLLMTVGERLKGQFSSMCVLVFSLGFLLTLSHIILQDFSPFCHVYLSSPLIGV